MNIKKTFGTNLRKLRTEKVSLKKNSRSSADFIVLISAILNAFSAMYHLRTFKKSLKLYKSQHISY